MFHDAFLSLATNELCCQCASVPVFQRNHRQRLAPLYVWNTCACACPPYVEHSLASPVGSLFFQKIAPFFLFAVRRLIQVNSPYLIVRFASPFYNHGALFCSRKNNSPFFVTKLNFPLQLRSRFSQNFTFSFFVVTHVTLASSKANSTFSLKKFNFHFNIYLFITVRTTPHPNG